MLNYERVLTVTEYYDGPKEGIADYRGKPHFYKCIWDNDKDNYSSSFMLSPLDDKIVKIAEEHWRMWLRWREACMRGSAPLESGPVLLQDRPRYEEMKPDLERMLVLDSDRFIVANGLFKETDAEGMKFEVLWTQISKQTAS